MAQLSQSLRLKGNPFENYVAESEPDIVEYAVKPPYFETIEARATNCASFILFGDRGAGKSATRLTLFKELWKKKAAGIRVPLAVNFTDYSSFVQGRDFVGLSEKALIKEVAFVVIEGVLTWLSSLEEDDRGIYLGALNDDEKNLCYSLLKDFYLSRPEDRRSNSVREAMVLFNQAFIAKSRLWVERRWDPIAKLVGTISDILLKKSVSGAGDIAGDIASILQRSAAEDFDVILVLRRLVQLVEIFDFSGIVVMVDKIDETEATNNSANKTAELIYPLLARVQLLEIQGFSWVFFVWSRVKSLFESQEFLVRLDKVGHTTVSWGDAYFLLMLDRRVNFFSDGRLNFSGLFEDGTNISEITAEIVKVSMRSPREIVRIMDTIIREHDINYSGSQEINNLKRESLEHGLDKYVTDVISTVYGERLLAQIFRLNLSVFTNRDVQTTFKVGAQSARTRIQSWESAGIIKLTGTRAAEGAQGGRPVNEYTIVDSRIERIMRRQLISYEGEVIGEEDE